MKILFTLDSLAMGGTEKSTLDIVKHFSKDTTVKVVYFYWDEALKESYLSAGISLLNANIKGKRNFYAAIKALVKFIRSEKPDVIVSSVARANLISRIAGLITGTKIIGTFINETYGKARIKEQKEKGIYLKYLYFWALDRFTSTIPKYWISNCKNIAESNAKALSLKAKKIQVIYRGREVDQFPPWQPTPTEEKFRFVFVGRLIERKGLMELVNAFVELKKTYPKIQLDIFGSGPSKNMLSEKVKELNLQDSIILHGVVLNGFKKLYDAHCFLFPSWYEGFSGSLVEAMIAGIPIIASNIGMNLEAVTDKKTALVFEVKNSIDLCSKMETIIQDYPAMIEMGKRAREEGINRFDIKVIAAQYEGFLKSVTNNTVDKSQLI